MDKITHIHIKGPLIKAAKALIPEKPNSLGWYKNHWAFLFDKEPSIRVLQIAEKSGFITYKDNSLTIIALPHVKEYEIKKANQRFNAFAEEYKDLSKKMTSVINRSINENPQVIKTFSTKREGTMANLEEDKKILEQRKKELEKRQEGLEKNKKRWFKNIEYQIEQMKIFFGKIEQNPFTLDMKNPNNPYYKNDLTGDLRHHLGEIKKTFEETIEKEKNIIKEKEDIENEEEDIRFEESNKSASNLKKINVKWKDYQKTINIIYR